MDMYRSHWCHLLLGKQAPQISQIGIAILDLFPAPLSFSEHLEPWECMISLFAPRFVVNSFFWYCWRDILFSDNRLIQGVFFCPWMLFPTYWFNYRMACPLFICCKPFLSSKKDSFLQLYSSRGIFVFIAAVSSAIYKLSFSFTYFCTEWHTKDEWVPIVSLEQWGSLGWTSWQTLQCRFQQWACNGRLLAGHGSMFRVRERESLFPANSNNRAAVLVLYFQILLLFYQPSSFSGGICKGILKIVCFGSFY